MNYYDAHCHLQDERISRFADEIVSAYGEVGVQTVVVNGTSEEDWNSVLELAKKYECVEPSFGLHPWKVNNASERWKERLSELWDLSPGSAAGEIGLDRWIEGFDMDVQEPAFLWQLQEAARRNLPVSIHCLRAWGRLQDLLTESARPERGFLLHSYGGPAEMVASFVELGAYFSISGYFALERKEKQRMALKQIPLDRLLIETDAPDMLGPISLQKYSFAGDGSLNHPANIAGVYCFVAELCELPLVELAEQVGRNFSRFFGPGSNR